MSTGLKGMRALTCGAGIAAAQVCGSALAADEDSTWRLVKAVSGTNSAKPAELLYLKEDDDSSTATSAALVWRGSPLPSSARVANSWGLAVGYSKNTLTTKRSELLTAGANVRSIVAVSSDLASNVVANLDLLFEDDRKNGARGHAAVLDATLVSPLLHLDPGLEPGKKERGLDAWLYPSVGLFRRHVSSTDSATEAPEGSHGGAYAGLRLTSRFLSIGKDLALLDRITFEAVAIRARESSVSGGYTKANYRYGELSLNYLLYGETAGKGWKPTIGFTRAKGTNRVENEPRVDRSVISFKVSYGI